jgi:hypothetical protein
VGEGEGRGRDVAKGGIRSVKGGGGGDGRMSPKM